MLRRMVYARRWWTVGSVALVVAACSGKSGKTPRTDNEPRRDAKSETKSESAATPSATKAESNTRTVRAGAFDVPRTGNVSLAIEGKSVVFARLLPEENRVVPRGKPPLVIVKAHPEDPSAPAQIVVRLAGYKLDELVGQALIGGRRRGAPEGGLTATVLYTDDQGQRWVGSNAGRNRAVEFKLERWDATTQHVVISFKGKLSRKDSDEQVAVEGRAESQRADG